MDHDRAASPALPASLVLALAAALSAAQPAAAASIYRCGNTFSQVPCPQAQVVELRDDQPRAADVQATREVASREANLADELARARERRERLALRQGAASLSARADEEKAAEARRAADRPLKSPSRSRSRKPAAGPSGSRHPDEFVAVVPGSGRRRGSD